MEEETLGVGMWIQYSIIKFSPVSEHRNLAVIGVFFSSKWSERDVA